MKIQEVDYKPSNTIIGSLAENSEKFGGSQNVVTIWATLLYQALYSIIR